MSQDNTASRDARAAIAVIDGQEINLATQREAIEAVTASACARQGFTLFTLNLDHLVKRRADSGFRSAYARATFVTADGAPVVKLTRAQAPAMARTTGADLVPPLCQSAAAHGLPVYLFGATPASLTKAAAALRLKYPGLIVAGMEAPALGFDPASPAADAAAARIAASGARIALIALGAPKQEIFADRAFARHPDVGFVCIGAALDFVSGEQTRAPAFFQTYGLEWLWRLGGNPRRLAARYLQCATLLTELIVLAAMRQGLRQGLGFQPGSRAGV